MSGNLYIEVTEQCNMNCPFCYTKFIPDFKDKNNSHINSDMAAAIINNGNIKDESDYDSVIFHGGEPLLYPDTINEILNKIKINTNVSIQTNLNHNLTKKQINLLIRFGGYGTSYSYDRFCNNKNALKKFEYNIKLLNSLGLKNSVIVTLTESHMNNCNPEYLKKYLIDDLDVDYVVIEREAFPVKTIDNNKQKFQDLYNRMDFYMTECAKIFPRDKNNLFKNMKKAIISNSSFFPVKCSKFVYTLFSDKLKYGCPSLESVNISNKDFMIKNKCFECEYFKYCQGDCECINHICAFPINLCNYVKKCIEKEKNTEGFDYYGIGSVYK